MVALFVHGPGPMEAPKPMTEEFMKILRPNSRHGAYVLSFHQAQQQFAQELCKILNSMEYNDLLKKLTGWS